MDDLISRQSAIDVMDDIANFATIEDEDYILQAEAIDNLKALPTAQPETHEERTETHACDLISRQAAIDAVETIGFDFSDSDLSAVELEEVCEAIGEVRQEWLQRIKRLPSAQPEIIRCNDCKHWTQTTGNMRGFGLGDCDYINAKLVNCNGFCYWAERRTDDND